MDQLGQQGLELGLLSTSSRLSWEGKLRWHLPCHPLPSVLLTLVLWLGLSFPCGDGSLRRSLSHGEPR